MTSDPVQFRLFNEIGIIAQLATSMFERAMPKGMTIAQFSLLNHFARLGGGKNPAALASAFQVTKATMTSTLQRLAAKGLVSIVPDPADGRGKRVSITDEGRQMRERCVAALAPELGELSKLWSPIESEVILSRLAELRQRLDKARHQRAAKSGAASDKMP